MISYPYSSTSFLQYSSQFNFSANFFCHNYTHRGDGYVEMDINVHRFSSVPKKALQILMKKYVTPSFLIFSIVFSPPLLTVS